MNGWNCQVCKGYNDILNNHCIFCFSDKPNYVTSIYQIGVEFKRDVFYKRNGFKSMTKDEELFAKYYNEATILVSTMSDDELLSHREQLKEIVLKGRAHLQAADDKIKQTRRGKNKEWLVSVETDQASSDAIAAVTVRRDRMSKLDKMRETLINGGMDSKIVDEMMASMSKGADKAITIPIAKKKEVIAIPINTESNGASEPFDATKLKF